MCLRRRVPELVITFASWCAENQGLAALLGVDGACLFFVVWTLLYWERRY